jgi:hypothetical protein
MAWTSLRDRKLSRSSRIEQHFAAHIAGGTDDRNLVAHGKSYPLIDDKRHQPPS